MFTSEDGLFLAILMALAGFSVAVGFLIRRIEQAASKWPRASGIIVTSATESQSLGRGRTEVFPIIEYEFTHEGRSFRSSHWRKFNFSVGNSISAQAVTARYPVGSSVSVLVNPRNPMRSVLECEPSWLCWVPFGFGIIFVAITALCVFLSVTRR